MSFQQISQAKGFTSSLLLCLCSVLSSACGPSPAEIQLKESQTREKLVSLKYQKKTEELIEKSKKLQDITHKLSEQQWRLKAVCSDHSDHEACMPYRALSEAKDTFCKDRFFVKHVDLIINSCHQGQCASPRWTLKVTALTSMLLQNLACL